MSDLEHTDADPEGRRAASRAELLPEEEAVGSEDPEGQAAQILAESDERTEDRNASPGTHLEHRSSEDGVSDPTAGPASRGGPRGR